MSRTWTILVICIISTECCTCISSDQNLGVGTSWRNTFGCWIMSWDHACPNAWETRLAVVASE